MVCEISKVIRGELLALADLSYKDFLSKLVPTLDKDVFIGVRMPILRKYAKGVFGSSGVGEFLSDLPHIYYEENNLHGLLICDFKDFNETVAGLDEFLPYVDNWSTCDMLAPKAFKKKSELLYPEILRWLESEHIYTKRFAMLMLMKHFLDEDFKPEVLDLVSEIRSDEYYINMMVAWFMATALAKQFEATLPYFENFAMEKWTHNKAIQKSVESFCISDETKVYLKTLKVK